MGNPIPPRIRKAIDKYRDHHLYPGGFVDAVLVNDMIGAIGRADAESMAALPAIVGYIHWEIPAKCHGNRARVNAWLEHKEVTT